MKTISIVLSTVALSLVAATADAAPQCETNYKQEGSFFAGRRFSTWADVQGSSLPAIYRKLYTEAVKSGLRIASADKEMGLISAEELTSDGKGQVAIPWNIAIEAVKTGIRVSVSKTTPPAYATGREAQIEMMCSVIASAK